MKIKEMAFFSQKGMPVFFLFFFFFEGGVGELVYICGDGQK